MTRVCKIILVCEGWRDSAFARGFLAAAAVDARAVDPKVNPGGCGHGWVKGKFVEEVANLTRFSEGRGVLGLMDEDGQGLAVREREVAELACEGRSNKEIAQNVCLRLQTVKKHLYSVFRKLEVPSRSRLVALAA